MGPNENWMSDVERELRNQRDYIGNLSVNQLASQGQANYQLPQRNPESGQQAQETIWLRLTEKTTIGGRIIYSWREQINVQTGTGAFWMDNGRSGTYQSEPAVGLNNDDVDTSSGKRYPARYNSDTNEWVFFSNQSSSQAMFRWTGNYWIYCGFNSEPSLNNSTSANTTKDTESLSAAILALNSLHYPIFPSRGPTYSPGLSMPWDQVVIQGSPAQHYLIRSGLTTGQVSLLQAHVVKVEYYSNIATFPNGTPADNSFPLGDSPSYAGVLTGVASGKYVPDCGVRYDGPGYGGEYYPLGFEHMSWDEADPATPYVGNFFENFDERFTSLQTSIYKRVTFKKYLANGTYNNQTNSITLRRQLPANATSDANNPIYFNYGPIRGNASHYTFPACISGTGFTGGTGNISVGWGDISMATSSITTANGPLTPP